MYVIIKLYLNRSYILDIIEPYLYPIYTLFKPGTIPERLRNKPIMKGGGNRET